MCLPIPLSSILTLTCAYTTHLSTERCTRFEAKVSVFYLPIPSLKTEQMHVFALSMLGRYTSHVAQTMARLWWDLKGFVDALVHGDIMQLFTRFRGLN